jgi:hypothetical protein
MHAWGASEPTSKRAFAVIRFSGLAHRYCWLHGRHSARLAVRGPDTRDVVVMGLAAARARAGVPGPDRPFRAGTRRAGDDAVPTVVGRTSRSQSLALHHVCCGGGMWQLRVEGGETLLQ